MLINDFNRADEQVLLLGATYDATRLGIEGLSIGILAAADTHITAELPMWREYDFSVDYSLSGIDDLPDWLSPLSFSAQYGLLQNHETNGRSDLSDQLRLILNYEFKATGQYL